MATLFGMLSIPDDAVTPMAAIKAPCFAALGKNYGTCDMSKSSSVPITSRDLSSCQSAGSSSAPSRGSVAADGLPRIGRISTEKRFVLRLASIRLMLRKLCNPA